MPINNAYQQYKHTQINIANQGKLILMLYDGAIKFINKAIEMIESKDIEGSHNNITRVRDIITELITSLNMEAGEISQRLFSIYMYINNRLTEANVKKDNKPLFEVKKHLTELRSAWEEASKKVNIDSDTQSNGGINIAT
jgi:flagellar secretion chaperone FliS